MTNPLRVARPGERKEPADALAEARQCVIRAWQVGRVEHQNVASRTPLTITSSTSAATTSR